MVTVMTPFLYLGVAPAQKVEAQQSTGSIIMGGVVGVMACYFEGFIEGFFDEIFGTVIGAFVDSVPVNETNYQLLNDVEQTAEKTAELIFKECVLDPIIWVIKRLLINFITQAILDWINDGFDNGPVFLTDLSGFFRDIAFTAFNTFLESSGLSQWLCSPFENDVRQTVTQLGGRTNYGSTGQNICSLENYVGGMGVDAGYERMVMQGDLNFEGGGIPAAMGLAIDSNNPYGSFFEVQSEAAGRVGRTTSEEATLLSYGDGYFSDKCDINGDGQREVCTPGQIISKQIDDWLGGGLGQLEVADEIAEVLGEVLAALVNNIFNDVEQGLLRGSRDTGDNSTVTSGGVSGGGEGGGTTSGTSGGGTTSGTSGGGSSSGGISGSIGSDGSISGSIGNMSGEIGSDGSMSGSIGSPF
ncbi:MAG: hypothetical protein UU98_C0002G0020 [Parcubacteria group bacterium GW2011_GWD2_42_14]|nr:MAG: hypothetical protein UU98_C0002G0020 [Parcubacteria group bacterium GW2011_GWD2_42_14]